MFGPRPPGSVAGSVADNADLQVWNRAAQSGRGFQQQTDPFAAVETPHEEDREARGRGWGVRELAAPYSQVDQLRHDRGKLLQAVKALRAFARIMAAHQHARGTLDVQPFATRLQAHGETGEPALEAHFVGDH